MIKNIYLKFKPLFLILIFITISSCEFNDNNKDYLGKAEVEVYADVVEAADSFVLSGYFKSLNSSKKSDVRNNYGLGLNVKDAANWKNVEVTIISDGGIKSGLLGDLYVYGFGPFEEGFCEIDIPGFELNQSYMQENFSIKFSKNISYKIYLLSFEGIMDIGVRHSDSLGCGDYMKTEYLVFEINQTIESL